MKQLAIALSLALSFSICMPSSYAAKPKKTHAAQTAAKNPSPETYDADVAGFKKIVTSCEGIYSSEIEVLDSDIRAAAAVRSLTNDSESAAMSALKAQQEVTQRKQSEGFKYKQCVDSAKQAMTDNAKTWVAQFKQESLKSMAKQVISQWLVVVDAVGQDNFDSELSKFDKSANDLRVELLTS